MIHSQDELGGMIKMLIHLYDQHQRSIDAEMYPDFVIEEKNNVYTVTFQWAIGEEVESHRTDYAPATFRTVYQTDYFRFLKDESLTKLEQYVEDVCDNVIESKINEL